MGIVEILLIGIGLSMDAFAVSVTNGLCYKNMKLGGTLADGLCFGIFQGAMPMTGYLLGISFAKYIKSFDHIVALVLLGYIGGQMIWEALKKKKDDEDEQTGNVLTAKTLLVQGIATSIDALAVGISFAALSDSFSRILLAALIICCCTLVISIAGVFIGKKTGTILNNKAQLVGGLILVGIGIKIFVEHVFFGG